jgi:hypothetical protein
MPDNVTTDTADETAPIGAEAWDTAFEPYSEVPISAYVLARCHVALKQFLQTQPPNVSYAAASLDEACGSLFPFTQFREAGYDLYRVAIEGRATRAQEKPDGEFRNKVLTEPRPMFVRGATD